MISTGKSIPYIPRLQNGLLNVYPGGKAWGVREMKTGYGGNYFKIRRSSDSTTSFFGGVGGVVDAAGILSFVGAGTGYVEETFNHGDGSVYKTQTITTKQPTICVGGAMNTNADGEYCLNFPSLTFLLDTNFVFLDNHSVFAVGSRTDVLGILYTSSGGSSFMLAYQLTTTPVGYSGMTTIGSYYVNTSSITPLRRSLYDSWVVSTPKVICNINFLVDGTWVAWQTGGYAFSGFDYEGNISCEVDYGSDQSANREGIQNKLISQYNVT